MPRVQLAFYREKDGRTPFLDWFARLPERAMIQCRARLELLAEHGHLLRRPAADYVEHGIYELRARTGRLQYRMLYFFHGRASVVVTHGFAKGGAAAPRTEIARARRRKLAFEADPSGHLHREST